MKKTQIKQSSLISYILMLFIVVALPFQALASDGIGVIIDGKELIFNSESGSPFIDHAKRTQVPLRATMEAFGCMVHWDSDKRIATVEKEEMWVDVPIGEDYILINGVRKDSDTAAVIKENRTYLPIRPVLEAFGASVEWDGADKNVVVKSGGAFLTPDYNIYYDLHYGVPDFGKVFACETYIEEHGFYVYNLSDCQVEDIQKYYRFLEDNGFEYYDEYFSASGESRIVYENSNIEVIVLMGLQKIGDTVYFVVEFH